MAGERNEPEAVGAIRRALELVTEAMDVLDAHGCLPNEAAHLAMVQQQFREALATGH